MGDRAPYRKPGIGHNLGPLLDGYGFRVVAWRKARAETFPRQPVEVVRRQVQRAAELGLSYRRYALIRATTGRDLQALIVTGRLEASEAAKLSTLRAVALLRLGPAEGLDWAEIAPRPAPAVPLMEAARAVRGLATGAGLACDAVAMIGFGARERAWAEAALLAGFIDRRDYF